MKTIPIGFICYFVYASDCKNKNEIYVNKNGNMTFDRPKIFKTVKQVERFILKHKDKDTLKYRTYYKIL